VVDKTLTFLADEINAFIQNKDFRYRGKNVALVSDVVDFKGEPTFTKRADVTSGDFLLITLINVEEEAIGKSQSNVYRRTDTSVEYLNPDIKINLYILTTAVSTGQEGQRYANCLKVLSYCVGFFQFKNLFDKTNSPSLPDETKKLVVELVSPTFEQQNHIWGGLGAKYQPSVLYKVRMLIYQEMVNTDGGAMVKRVRADINGNN
jgi:hypothetical protein